MIQKQQMIEKIKEEMQEAEERIVDWSKKEMNAGNYHWSLGYRRGMENILAVVERMEE